MMAAAAVCWSVVADSSAYSRCMQARAVRLFVVAMATTRACQGLTKLVAHLRTCFAVCALHTNTGDT